MRPVHHPRSAFGDRVGVRHQLSCVGTRARVVESVDTEDSKSSSTRVLYEFESRPGYHLPQESAPFNWVRKGVPKAHDKRR